MAAAPDQSCAAAGTASPHTNTHFRAAPEDGGPTGTQPTHLFLSVTPPSREGGEGPSSQWQEKRRSGAGKERNGRAHAGFEEEEVGPHCLRLLAPNSNVPPFWRGGRRAGAGVGGALKNHGSRRER